MTILHDKTLTLDDFIQLQALLNYEQAERDRHIRDCESNIEPVFYIQPVVQSTRYVQFRREINPQASLQSSLERARLAEALIRLKWLKEQYKRQRTLEVQLYLENYRRQALIRSVLEEEEEMYYRQCIAAAVEQARIQLCIQQFLDQKQQEQQKQQEKLEWGEQHLDDYGTYHTEQLKNVLQYIFNQQNLDEPKYQKQARTEEEQAKNMAQVWKFLSDQKENEVDTQEEYSSSDQDEDDGEYYGEYKDDELEEQEEIEERIDVKREKMSKEKEIDSPYPSIEEQCKRQLQELQSLPEYKVLKQQQELRKKKQYLLQLQEQMQKQQLKQQQQQQNQEIQRETQREKVEAQRENQEAQREYQEAQKEYQEAQREYQEVQQETQKAHQEAQQETQKAHQEAHQEKQQAQEDHEIQQEDHKIQQEDRKMPHEDHGFPREDREIPQQDHEISQENHKTQQDQEIPQEDHEIQQQTQEAQQEKQQAQENHKIQRQNQQTHKKKKHKHNKKKNKHKKRHSHQQQPTIEHNEPLAIKETEFPPIQNHVLPLQKLIQTLASEPILIGEQSTQYSDEPKPSGIWAKDNANKPKQQTKSPTLPPLFTHNNKVPFLPHHMITEAEPTPTLEHMPNSPLGAQEEEEEEQQEHFVNTIAAEQKNEIVPPDPRKLKMYEELETISHLLSDPDSNIVKRWKNVLQGGKDGKQTLDFSKQKEGTLLLTATTPFNRQFLGSEDELLRTMLRLDAVDSFDDPSIREKRKKLVKTCESMLDNLDHYKQSQWEKAMIKNKS